MRYVRHKRTGFTLIEMLVAMALTLFIMAILSQAFVAGLDTFRGLKAIGDMQQALRVALTSLRHDLSQDHFEGGRKLSDSQMNRNNPPKEGYVFIRQGSVLDTNVANSLPGKPYQLEGFDADGIPSYRASDHSLAFTVKLRGNKRENVLMSYDIVTFPPPPAGGVQQWSPLSLTKVYFLNQRRDALHNPGGPPATTPYPNPDIFASQWAEVGYFLVKTGTTDEPDNPSATSPPGIPLYSLYRTQYLLVPNPQPANLPDVDNDPVTKDTTLDNFLSNGFYVGVSCYDPNPANAGDRLVFNGPVTVANTQMSNTPGVTLGMQARVAFNQRKKTLVCANVVSFQVQTMRVVPGQPGQGTFEDVSLFDTTLQQLTIAGAQSVNWDSGLSSLKITLRVFDPTTRFARQLSLVQEL